MPLMFRQKYYLGESLTKASWRPKLILVLEPEEYLLRIYARYFSFPYFQFQACQTWADFKRQLVTLVPDLLIVNTDQWFYDLLQLKIHWPSQPIISLGHNLTPEQLKQLMAYGISGHINRKFTRPQDLVEVVKTILMMKY